MRGWEGVGLGTGSSLGLEVRGGRAWDHPGTHSTPGYNAGATPREHDIPPFFCLGGVVGSPLTAPSSPEAFEDLKKDPEPGVREFATKQFYFLQEVTARPR